MLGGKFWSRREEHREKLVRFLASQGPLAMLLDTVGNIGDALIREGTRHMMADAGLQCEEESAGLTLVDSSSKTLVLRGSGGFDRLFNKFMPDVVLRAAALYRRVIILPSSFDPREPVVSRCLSESNVIAIAREMQSFQAISSAGSRLASMDCALHHRRFSPRALPMTALGAGGEVLLALRRDKGSPLGPLGLEPNRALNNDISLSANSLDDWLDQISRAGSVVTDRLHVAAAAVLMGKKLDMIDPYDNKLSAYLDFCFEGERGDQIQSRTIQWLVSEGLAVPVRN
jgi:hypothetical protein